MIEKLFTKETIYVAICAFIMVVQSNYFATKLDLANLKLEIAAVKDEVKDYSDRQDKELLKEIDDKFQILSQKIDRLK